LNIGDLVRGLTAIGLDCDFPALRDILWLAGQVTPMPAPEPTGVKARGRRRPAASRPGALAAASGQASRSAAGPAARASVEEGQPALYAGAGSGSRPGSLVRLRGRPALPGALAVERALRPLARRRAGDSVELDESATAAFIAETGGRLPVWRPAFERWFDVVLAIDEVPSMVAWRPLVVEFERVLRRQGGFRDVRVLRLESRESGVFATGPGGKTVPTRDLHDRHGRRLVLVLSDCTSSAWRRGAMGAWLQSVTRHAPLTIVQLLPQALWPNTATGFAELRVKAPRLGCAASQLEAWKPSWAVGEPGLVLPVLALAPSAVARWARMMNAAGNAWSTAALLPLPGSGGHVREEEGALSAGRRAALFRASATPDAQRLAAFFCAVKPLTPPVMRVIQEAV